MAFLLTAWAPFTWLGRAFTWEPAAMWGGLCAAAACGAVGSLLRWRRLVWAGFAVPEAATVGTAFVLGHETLLARLGVTASLPGFFRDPHLWVLVATTIAVLWLVPIGQARRRGGERAAAACFLAGATLSVMLVSQSPHGTEEIRALATGKTLLFLLPEDATLLAWTMGMAAVAALFLARPLAAIAFDREHACAVGYPVKRLELAFALLLGGLVVLAAPRAGAPFLFACLTLPPAAAERVVARPIPVLFAAMVVAVLGYLLGAALAIGFDLPWSTAAIGGVLATTAAGMLLAGILRGRRASP